MFFKRLKIVFSIAGRLLHVFYQMLWGAWRISRLNAPIVTVFGGGRFKLDDPYAMLAQHLSTKFVEAGVSVITGGNTGIMEAVSYGAIVSKDSTGKSIGIGVRDLGEGKNQYVSEYFELDYFFARKWLMTRFSNAFIVFPGGFGTLDEMSEILTLIKTKRMPCMPIVLIGTEYWNPWYSWLINEALSHGTVTQQEINLFVITDDLDKAFNIIYANCTF